MSVLHSKAGWRHFSSPNTLYLSHLMSIFARTRVPGIHKGGKGKQLEPRNLSRDPNVTLIVVQTQSYHSLSNPSPCVTGCAIIVPDTEHADELYKVLAPACAR